jgi:hypothetical protein
MKKSFLTVISLCILTWLLTSTAGWKEPGNVLHSYSKQNIDHDSTGYLSPVKVDSFKLAILPPSCGVQFYKNGIVFLSLSKNEAKMIPDHISFGTVEAYYAIPGDSVLGPHKVFSPGSSFSYPCESMTFNYDFNTMYFSKFSAGDEKEKIYLAKFTNKGKKHPAWLSEVLPLDFCRYNSTYSHPALSADENILIFASDMEGTYGGMDLFISRKNEGKWSQPENLGKLINTAGNEYFPSLDPGNNLFFSSDGLAGNGGFDIFTSRFTGKAWEKPVNLSTPVNSSDDDIAFIINRADGKTAFFTRRKQSEKEKMQLFKVTLNPEEADNNLITISSAFFTTTETSVAIKDEKTDSVIARAETKPVVPETKMESTDTVIAIPPAANENNEVVAYKVQLLSSTIPKGKYQVTVAGNSYDTFEYFYKGSYRYTIGDFGALLQAVALQNICRSSGYPQAFVVAFKNNIRSLDPALFK